MNQDEPQSSSEVAHEAENARTGLAKTLGELRENLTPQHIAEEVVGNVQIGASALLDNGSAFAREHPLPVLLAGVGLAMVLGVGARSASKPGRSSGRQSGKSVLGTSRSQAGATYKGYSSMSTMTRHSSLQLSDLMHDQPLIIAALGIAVGAAIGAALPVTTAEDEWMGRTSSSVRQAAKDAAESELGRLKDVASRTAESIQKSASESGLSAENLTELARTAGEQAKAAVHEAVAPVSEPKT